MECNEAIIKLIKNKIKPLQHSKFSLHHSHKRQTTSENFRDTKASHIRPQISFPSLPSAPLHHILTEKVENEYSLIEKARSYIEGQRRGKPSQM